MAVKDPKVAGSTFLAEVLGKLSPEAQAKVKEVFEDAAAAAALEVIGQGTLRQSDYSRQANELQAKEAELEAWKGQLDTWFTTRKTDLTELEDLRQKVKGLPNPDPARPTPDPAKPALDPAKYLTREDWDRAQADVERGAVRFFADSQRLSIDHYRQFGEVLDLNQLLEDKRIAQLGLDGVYKEVHKEKLDAKTAAAKEAEREAIRKEEREKLQKEIVQHPYPVRGNEPSTLVAIEAAQGGQQPVLKSVDDMAAEYARLGAARAG